MPHDHQVEFGEIHCLFLAHLSHNLDGTLLVDVVIKVLSGFGDHAFLWDERYLA